MNTERTKYILFCAQEGNFQTRSMLIPYDLFKKSKRWEQFEKLKAYSTFDNDLGGHLCIEHVIDGQSADPDMGKFIDTLIHYAEWGAEIGYSDEDDKEWVDAIPFGLPASMGFMHKDNFRIGMKLEEFAGKPIEIVEGILVLEKFMWSDGVRI